jgi:hypothetical protein
MEEKMNEWKKYYSKSRKRDYYFNARTNKSLWTLDEVKKEIEAEKVEKPSSSQCHSGESAHQQDKACAFPLVLI